MSPPRVPLISHALTPAEAQAIAKAIARLPELMPTS
jgi:hypothetical protein